MLKLPCTNKTCCHLAKRVLDRLKWATHANERYTGIRVYKECRAYNMYNLIRGQNRKKNCHKGEVSNTAIICFIFWYVQNYSHKKREDTAG